MRASVRIAVSAAAAAAATSSSVSGISPTSLSTLPWLLSIIRKPLTLVLFAV